MTDLLIIGTYVLQIAGLGLAGLAVWLYATGRVA